MTDIQFDGREGANLVQPVKRQLIQVVVAEVKRL